MKKTINNYLYICIIATVCCINELHAQENDICVCLLHNIECKIPKSKFEVLEISVNRLKSSIRFDKNITIDLSKTDSIHARIKDFSKSKIIVLSAPDIMIENMQPDNVDPIAKGVIKIKVRPLSNRITVIAKSLYTYSGRRIRHICFSCNYSTQ